MPDNVFNTDFSQTVDKIVSRYDQYILIGDVSFDMLNRNKSETVVDICDVVD
jgi:predicted solute-binding protein